MNRLFLTVLGFLFVTETTCVLYAQNLKNYDIQLKSRNISVSAGFATYNQGKAKPQMQMGHLLSGKYHAVIQFADIPTESQKQEMNNVGITLYSYIPNYAYTASINPSLTEAQLKALGIRSATFFNQTIKLTLD